MAPDADAISSAALSALALGGAELAFQSSDDSVSSEHPDTIGVDVRPGERSIKGRDSSAAEVIANAMKEMGWHFEQPLNDLVSEVTAIDRGDSRRCARLNLGRIVQCLRAVGWDDVRIVRHLMSSIERNEVLRTSPIEEVLA